MKWGNSHQLRPRGVGVRLEILSDVSAVAPVVDEGELEYRHVDAMKWQDVLMRQPLPSWYRFPKDLLCFLEVLRWVDAECFEGHIPVAPGPPPNIGGST